MKTNITDFLSSAKTWGCEKCGSLFFKQNNPTFCPICGDNNVQKVISNNKYPDIELLIDFHKNTPDYEKKIQNFINPVKFKTEQLKFGND